MTKLTKGLAVLALGLMVPACASDTTAPVRESQDPAFTPSYVIDPVVKTAEGHWSRTRDYDWTIEKNVTPASLELNPGEQGTFNYVINVTRGAPEVSDVYKVTGQICIANPFQFAVTLTSLIDEFYSFDGTTLTLVQSTPIDFSGNPELAVGEQGCYPYELTMPAGFTPGSLQYKNRAKVLGVQTGTTNPIYGSESVLVPVVFPAEPTLTETDATADVVDALQCPLGFTCTPMGANWTFGASASQPLTVVVRNVSAACGQHFTVVNRATVTENDSGDSSWDDATSTIDTGDCGTGPFAACTPGFWQGGKGSKLWNTVNDPQWKGALSQPFYAGTLFNSFFTPHPNMNGETMLATIKNGGTSDPVNKAARSLVAAYLNSSYAGYPYSQAQLKALWTAALAGGHDALLALHTDLDWKNNAYACTN